jgi:di/tripeptidase
MQLHLKLIMASGKILGMHGQLEKISVTSINKATSGVVKIAVYTDGILIPFLFHI